MGKTNDTTRTEYRVADGIAVVAGRPVPGDRKVVLSEREALYDLALGRIILPPARKKTVETPPPPVATEPDAAAADAGN